MFRSAMYMGMDCVSLDQPSVARKLIDDEHDPLDALLAEEDDDLAPTEHTKALCTGSPSFVRYF